MGTDRDKPGRRRIRKRVLAVLLAALAACPATLGWSQQPVRIDVEAYRGTPFGVGRITVRTPGDLRVGPLPRPGGGRIVDLARRIADQAGKGEPKVLHSAELSLTEASRRTFYPVFAKRERPVLNEFVRIPGESTIYFLFQGDEPLELTVHVPQPVDGVAAVGTDATGHARLLRQWWRDYSAAAEARDAPRDYPQMVEEYLTATLARRLRLNLPSRTPQNDSGFLRGELNLLAGTEALRLEVAERVLRGGPVEDASLPIPEELPAPQPEVLAAGPEVAIEPLAMRVPAECLYVRFGNFPNFLWLRRRLENWGGELRDIVSVRGLDYGLNERMQRQLGLRESKLAELLGDKVIADVALIGTDAFVSEGAAIGTLFHAKSNTALTADLMQQRLTAMREADGGQQQRMTISGRRVSHVFTADGRLRSYYVVDGDFHLVTTSRKLVEWFLDTADGTHPSLGASERFRYTRGRMPLERQDTVFVYLSPEFFEHLLGPHYQIEMRRRLRSDVELELVPIARLAARAEGFAATTIEQLVAADLLPDGFGTRPDGSTIGEDADRLVDSLRGARGTFLPILDTPLERVTPGELAEYQQFRAYFNDQWGRFEPVVLGIRREPLEGGQLERVVLDVQAAPLAPRHVEQLSQWLGEPTTRRLAPVSGNAVSFEAVVRGGTLFTGGEHHLFGGLRDADPALVQRANTGLFARIMQSQLQGFQGYLGAWPEPGYLRWIGGASPLRGDAAGYTRLPTGTWRRQFDGFTLLSFYPEMLEQVSSELQFVEVERPAQFWLHAGDLANSSLAPLINAYGYRQSRQIVAGNTRFLNLLAEQLHVPAADALAVGESLLGARLIDPLGGQYELRSVGAKAQQWVATALEQLPADMPPADYQFQALNWLRGVELEIALNKGREPVLSLHGEFIMPVETRTAATSLPRLPADAMRPEATRPPAEPTPSTRPRAGREF